ncbi:hypothetical protein P7K49_003215 [Saguinus oedipus]|uniref:Uncharacterized protein n=1 Tax=Saguinus oedipus TaxID=9490 RepID=A0ABQ9WJJ4_SAGOE|nr:hypothetical protein P7K49_003215 [Saguinus oedipus]
MSDGHLAILFSTEEELRKLREETNAEMLRQELDRERQRRMELEQKVQEVLKARYCTLLNPQPPKPLLYPEHPSNVTLSPGEAWGLPCLTVLPAGSRGTQGPSTSYKASALLLR